MKSERLRITLLVPTLDEITAVKVIMQQIDRDWIDEILVIDGGSTDGTIEYLEELGYTLHIQNGSGFGEGMLEGMKKATGEIIVEFTPDGNSLPLKIPELVEKIEEGYDLVVASRYLEGAKSEDDDYLTAFGNWLFTKIVNVLFRTHYTDVLVGFRAYRKSIALKINMDAPGLSWPCQSSIRFAQGSYKVTEIPADEPKRIGGQRKMKPFKTGLEITKLILRDFLKDNIFKS